MVGCCQGEKETNTVDGANRRIGVCKVNVFLHVGAVGAGSTVEFICVINICRFNFECDPWWKNCFCSRDKGPKYRGTPCARVEHLGIVFE